MSELDQSTPATENAGIAVPGEHAPAPQNDDAAPRSDASSDVESRARAMGWVPQEEFRGPADKWRSADEFVKVGENELPVLRENLRRTTTQMAEMQRRLAERDEMLVRLERMTATALERQRAQLDANYEAAMRAAAASGDLDRYDQLQRDRQVAVNASDEQIRRAVQPQQAPAQGGAAPPLPVEHKAKVDAWVADNQWFDRDPTLRQFAVAVSQEYDRTMPGLSLEDNLRRVRAEVERRFPEKFGRTQPASYASAPVEGGGRVAVNGGRREKGVAELPADARRQGEKFVREKLFKDLNAYAREYWQQDGA